MKLAPIVQSLLDTDLYKVTMQQAIFHKHTDLTGEYHFKCRNKNVHFTDEMVQEINDQVDHLCTLTFQKEELEWLRGIRFIKPDYVEFLRLWRPLRDYVTVNKDNNGELKVVVKGPIFSAMPFEIYLLEIINEVYFRFTYDYTMLLTSATSKLDEKINKFNDANNKYLFVNNEGEAVGNINNSTYNFKFAEFGARRRLSREWQDEVVRRLSTELVNKNCVGTSNMYLAKKYNLTPIGTFAHEFVQMYQGIDSISPAYTNYYALKDWYDEYQGDLGTALTDTIGTDVFLLDFNQAMAKLFTGVRHDSGNPYEWGEKILSHYRKYGIDPKTKTLLFSDSLDFDRAQKLYDYFKDRTNVSFGIGTYLTNDTFVLPLNIVIKLQYVNGKPVAKLSDNPGKTMCSDDEYADYLKRAVDWRLTEKAWSE
jgi:nicotinate phosphoribosyltransferase